MLRQTSLEKKLRDLMMSNLLINRSVMVNGSWFRALGSWLKAHASWWAGLAPGPGGAPAGLGQGPRAPRAQGRAGLLGHEP